MTAEALIAFTKKRADAHRIQIRMHTADGNDSALWTNRVAAMVTEDLIDAFEQEMLRVRPELNADFLASVQQAQGEQ